MKISANKILTPEGFLPKATIHIENGVIAGIGPYCESADIRCEIAAPGLIDQHTHGGFGADVMLSGPQALAEWARFMARNGTTKVLASAYTYPIKDMRQAMENVRQAMRLPGGEVLAGVHLEGPFLSKSAPGAMMPEYILKPSISAYKELVEGYEDLVKLVTIAPEEPGALELAAYLNEHGVRVLAGHTVATCDETKAAFDAGIGGITHFFNAAAPIHHRKPGILTAALLDDRIYCESISDFVHVHPDAVKLIHKCKGARRMILVSDAVFTTGLPDGEYTSNLETYVVKNGQSRTLDGSLAGGGDVLLEEVRKLIGVGIAPEEALWMASQTPADFLRIPGGKIIPGARAEIVCLNEKYEALASIIGEKAYEGAAK